MTVNPHSPFLCQFCQKPLDPKMTGTMIRVTGWISSSRTGVVRGAGPAIGYAHKVCLDLALKGGGRSDSQIGLF